MPDNLSYQASGVNYDLMDPVKILAQRLGKKTSALLEESGFSEVAASRGESAHVIDMGDFYLASIEEGLGTKNLVADEVHRLTGKHHYAAIAQDTVAMMVNDLITVGAKPLVVHAYWAVGSSEWFAHEEQVHQLLDGWAYACDLAGAVWGGGETPTLSGLVNAESIDLAGACMGIIRPRENLLIGKPLAAGLRIVVFASSGIHANGLTLARKLAEQLPEGFLTRMDDGRHYGDALLDPTIIYARLVESLLAAKVDLRYLVNITGHGWRKLMRRSEDWQYIITDLPPVPAVLNFIQQQSGLGDEEMYGNFNMGAGFAAFVAAKDVAATIKLAAEQQIMAYDVGFLQAGPKQVELRSIGVTFGGESLKVRE